MPKAASPRRDGLAWLEATLPKDGDDLSALMGWTCRDTQRRTPDAAAVIRLTQALAIRSLMKAMTGDPSLATLTRTKAELLKGMRVLGIPLPDGQTVARRTPRAQPRRESSAEFITPERVGGHRGWRPTPAPAVEEDLGGDDPEHGAGDDDGGD